MSTPFGRRGFFNQVWEDAGPGWMNVIDPALVERALMDELKPLRFSSTWT
jgi:hypothetical protein